MIEIKNKRVISEVNTILKQLDKINLNNIPKEILQELENNSTVKTNYIKLGVPLKELNLEEETKDFLAVLMYRFFCTKEERIKLVEIMKEK